MSGLSDISIYGRTLRLVHRVKTWRAVVGSVLLAFGLLLVFPGQIARSVRLDPLSQAESLIYRGDYRGALVLLNGLSVDRLDVWAMRRLELKRAICLKALGAYEEAGAGFLALEGAFDALADYLAFWRGECLEAAGKLEGAVVSYSRLLEMESSSLMRDEAGLRAAGLQLAAGRPREAVALYRRVLGLGGEEVRALVGLAKALEAAGDSAEARDMRFQLIRDYSEAPEAVDALREMEPLELVQEKFYGAVAYAKNGKSQPAVRLFRQIVRGAWGANWQGRAQYELGLVFYEKGDYRTAERAFEIAYRTYKVPRALFDMARCSIKFGRDLKAAEQFQTFAQLYPSIPGASEALWNAAMAYERRRRFGQAREVFLTLAVRYPKSDFADQGRWRVGFTLFKQQEYAAAAQTFLKLSRTTSEGYLRDQGYYWAGKCYQRLGKEEEGQVLIRRAAEGFPTSYYSSRARAVMDVDSEVYAAVRGVLKDPDAEYESSIYLVKGDLLADAGLYRDAQREYGRAQRAHGGSLYALGDLLQRYERIGAMNQALQVSNQMVFLEQQQGLPMTLSSFRRLYPTYYWGEISRTARELDLDPNLILAIIRQESAFNEEALSRAGARGLMQVMPETGRMLARQIRLKNFSEDDLWKPQMSIRLGARHLSDHMHYFKKSEDRKLGLALSAYNAGLNAARSWSRRLTDRDVDEFVESIPYRETRNYVKLVYRNYQVYSYLQGEQTLHDGDLIE